MQAILSLARNTLVDALRERVYRTLGLFLIVLLGVTRLLDPLALGEGRRVTLDLGLTLTSLFGFLLILMLGTRVVQKEIERKTILLLLARPISRAEFLLGKFFGIVAVVGSGLLGMLLILAAVLWISGYGVTGALAIAGVYAFLELFIVAALSMLLTVFTSPVLSSFFLLGLFVAGHLSPSLLEMARLLPNAVAARGVEVVFLLVPRFDLYSYTLEAVHGWMPSPGELLWAVAYALFYATAALLVALLVFRRRQFS